MLRKLSLLDELRKGGFEASLITTFNAYLPFYEEVVLRRLMSTGVRHNVLLMDAQQYAVSLGSHTPRLAGRRYTLMPLKVAGAFHPKLILLVGKHKGLVAVGSHNLTLAGFGFNRELTNVVRIQGADDKPGIAIVHEAWAEVEQWLMDFGEGVPPEVANMVRRVREFAPWLKARPTPGADFKLLAGRPGGPPLWEQLTALVDGEPAEVTLTGAFFDQELRFLHRVKQDLGADGLTVGVDPDTVDMPRKALSESGVSIVRAERLGVEEEKEEGSPGYLHAKGILVRQKNGDAVFASGSANPSAPAWLATDSSGNVELMLARRGASALVVAQEIGFTELAGMPALDDSDWQRIEDNRDHRIDVEPPSYGTGLAVVTENRVLMDLRLLAGVKNPEFVLLTVDGQEISRSRRMTVAGDLGAIEFAVEQVTDAFALHCIAGSSLKLRLLLHHSRALEEQARTGVQRRFKEALLSLATDTPNIGLLIECIDRIVLCEDKESTSGALQRVRSGDREEASERAELGSLAIDVADVKERKAKRRLSHSGDFAYLLDALIYHLRVQEDKAIEELDGYGRSEEEQVGADDEEDADSERPTPEQQGELLKLCHGKVRTVINRIVVQIKAFSEGRQSLNQVLVRLLGVLAVLRELRSCDGRVAWVEKGKTTVPRDQRLRLLEEVMLNLFEGDSSMLHMEGLGEEFQQSDDVARLKGLLLWLAWDCGLTLDLKKPFMESRSQLQERLRNNAMVLALTQMIRGDEVVIDEARQSIGSVTSGEMNWLKDVQRLAAFCESVHRGERPLGAGSKAAPGDVAMHRTLKNWDLRVVAGSGGGRVSLIRLSKKKDRLNYTQEYIDVAHFL